MLVSFILLLITKTYIGPFTTSNDISDVWRFEQSALWKVGIGFPKEGFCSKRRIPLISFQV